MRVPGLTAEATLHRSARHYAAMSSDRGATAQWCPRHVVGYWAVLAAACLAALADAVPGDEVVACGSFYFECQQIDA